MALCSINTRVVFKTKVFNDFPRCFAVIFRDENVNAMKATNPAKSP